MKIQSLFEAAVDLPPDEREEFLRRECGGDQALRQELDSLLASFQVSEDELEQSPVRLAEGNAGESIELPADGVPGYEILHELHRGGQGVVFKAIQLGTRREVALKFMLTGPLAGAANKRRFEREVAVVGSLRHPGIVPVFDSGLAEGRYYYVMDYVDGVPLDRFVRDESLSIRETVELLGNVCEAVQYAHQRGVIHRDLKPSNILVDRQRQPHVLDFGLAKRAGDGLKDTLTLTMDGQILGTLSYMSPEQAAGKLEHVDTRSDVYALGVVLYVLLTGELPYALEAGLAQDLVTIQFTEPNPQPLGERRVGDEVAAIVGKALQKNPSARYENAGALGADLQRCLRGEPIAARGGDWFYLARKRVRRHAVALGIAFTLIVGIAIGVIISQQGRWDLPGIAGRQPPDETPPLVAGRGGRSYTHADLETQLLALGDLHRRNEPYEKLRAELEARFGRLGRRDFVPSLSDQAAADLEAMTSLARFLTPELTPAAARVRLAEHQASPPRQTSGMVNDLLTKLLRAAVQR